MSKVAIELACKCQLRAAAKAVLKELAWFADDKGERIWPSVRTLAERTGYGRRAVQKILRELERTGAIEALGSRLGGRHRTTRYRMVLAWFEASPKAKKGERHDSETANESARNGEQRAPEEEEQKIEQYEKTPPNRGKADPTEAYQQQRLLQVGRTLVGKTADTLNLSESAKFALSAEIQAILSLSPLTSNVASRMIVSMTAKKNPNAVALWKMGGKARAASLSAKERSEAASKAGKARSEKLTAAERSRIAKLAVQARERKRKQEKHVKNGGN